jgi:hypothetical protein
LTATSHPSNKTKAVDLKDVFLSFKAISVQTWTGPEGSRRLRLPDFKTIGT